MKNLFSYRYYLESLRKLRISAIVSIVFLSFFSLASLSGDISNLEYLMSPVEISFFELVPHVYIFFMFVFIILLTSAFSYLNKRSSSDFFDSVYIKRKAAFISRYAAVITWGLVALIVPIAIAIVEYSAYPDIFIIDYSSIFLSTVSVFLRSLYISACLMIGMFLSGTSLSGTTMGIVIIAYPIALNGIIYDYLQDTGSVSEKIVTFFYQSNPIVSSYSDPKLPYLIYAAVMIVILTFISGVIFVKRRSETAEKASCSKTVSDIVRIMLSSLIMTPTATYCILDDYIGDFVATVIFAFIVYVAYELFTERKAKNIPKTLPMFLVSIAISLIPTAILLFLKVVFGVPIDIALFSVS